MAGTSGPDHGDSAGFYPARWAANPRAPAGMALAEVTARVEQEIRRSFPEAQVRAMPADDGPWRFPCVAGWTVDLDQRLEYRFYLADDLVTLLMTHSNSSHGAGEPWHYVLTASFIPVAEMMPRELRVPDLPRLIRWVASQFGPNSPYDS